MKKILFIFILTATYGIAAMAQNCVCNPNGWRPFEIQINASFKNAVCNDTVQVRCKDSVLLKGDYKCGGVCNVTYKASLLSPGGIVTPIPSFSFPWFHSFTANGTYTLIITPYCGQDSCKPCYISFKVSGCENCVCTPNGWSNFDVSINGSIKTAVCNDTANIKCNDSIILKGNYKCKGNCNARYTASLLSPGGVVTFIPSFSFPWFHSFTANGTYTLIITPYCGQDSCKPCYINFKVSGCEGCVCNPNGWSPFGVSINGSVKTAACNDTLTVKCNDSLFLKGGYKCVGNCNVRYTASLLSPGGVVTFIPSFSFPWFHSFTANGAYTLIITPYCGQDSCKPCHINFKVSGCRDCVCNPNGWSPFDVSINGSIKTAVCNDTANIKCNDSLFLKGGYKCLGNCNVRYTASLLSPGGVVTFIPSFSFPWFHSFTANGAYTLIITPYCGQDSCKPCYINFKVSGCQNCVCNPNGWKPFDVQINNVFKTAVCNDTINVKCKDSVFLKGSYKCTGDCNVKYTASLLSPGGILTSIPSFSFPWFHSFTANGTYTLIITPYCGQDSCKPCYINFNVSGCEDCVCNPNGWGTFDVLTNASLKTAVCNDTVNVKCNDSVFLKGGYKCKGNCNVRYTASLLSPGGVITFIPSFSFPWVHSFTGNGSYTLIITPYCGQDSCKPCYISFIVLGCERCVCNPNGWSSFKVQINGSVKIAACNDTVNVTCKDSVLLKGGYKCKGVCRVRYTAKLLSPGGVITYIPAFSFPWLHVFTANGSYTLIITPYCGQDSCKPCYVNFIVSGCNGCVCNPDGWKPFDLQINNVFKTAACNDTVNVKCRDSVFLKGNYKCTGDCNVKYTASLLSPGGIITPIPSFSFPWFHTFSANGTYTLKITPFCGSLSCKPCNISFKVSGCQDQFITLKKNRLF